MTNLGSTRGLFYNGALNFVDRLPVLIIIGSIWVNDTMAYIAGSLIGKTPLTSISPKKTWKVPLVVLCYPLLLWG